jgi:hypothetical protein
MKRQQVKCSWLFLGHLSHWHLVMALVLCVTGFMALSPLAHASSDPTSAQYKDVVTNVSNDVTRGDGGRPASSSASGLQRPLVSALPFTGLDLIAVTAVAVALTSVGLALRWLTAGRELRS